MVAHTHYLSFQEVEADEYLGISGRFGLALRVLGQTESHIEILSQKKNLKRTKKPKQQLLLPPKNKEKTEILEKSQFNGIEYQPMIAER